MLGIVAPKIRLADQAFLCPPSLKLRTGAAGGDVGEDYYYQADEAGNRFGYMDENAEEHR